ncbi:MAG TPA: CAP domain-containing protein [Thermoanaerobaculia bacterium]|nr:CAP domain-containing protein [Thermoanaerobaculia bacterium]
MNTLTLYASILYANNHDTARAPQAPRHPRAPQAAGAAVDPEAFRRELLRRLDDERAAAGAPPLRLSPALDRAAQRHVDEIGARGSLRGERRPEQAMDQRLREAGYDAHQWAENLMSGPAGPAELVAAWRRDDGDGTFRRLLEPTYSDVGIGIGRLRLDGAPLYSILFAVPESAAFARETAALRDRERVRAELVTRVDEERRRAGRQPLGVDSRLEAAAERHADDMLARSYFAHRDPDGKTIRERAREAGFDWSAIGENIAEGQQSVKEVVESWMRSAGHRENILDRRYTRTGIGLALGRDPKTGEYRILWVQTFGLQR